MTEKKQSAYTLRLIDITEKNNKVSSSFCLAKWKQVSINLTAGYTHSCYHPPEHKIPLDELAENPSALHNTSFKKAERAQMIKGERPDGCSYCWKIEDSPGDHMSDRTYRSSDLESIQPNVYDEITQHFDPANYNVVPTNVEVNFSGVCNFKCSYCSPHLSTEWKKEIDKHGPYPTIIPHNSVDYFKQIGIMPIPNREDNPYVDAFWKWWPELYPTLQVFRMTGGEPLMDVNTYKVLDYIIDNPNPNLHLAITTNLCPDKKLLDKFFAKLDQINEKGCIKELTLYVSCDAYGKRAEYIRNGMNFEYLIENANRFLANYDNRKSGIMFHLSFINTINLLSITSLRKFIENVIIKLRIDYNLEEGRNYKQRVFVDFPILHFPEWQSIQLLSDEYCDILRNDIAYFKNKIVIETLNMKDEDYAQLRDFEIAKLERVLSWMEQGKTLPLEKLKENKENFYRFFKEHDARRDTSFVGTFPEMIDFWNNI